MIILLIDQPDLGQSILLTSSWIATVFVSGISLVYIGIFLATFLILFSSLLFLLPEKFGYIINRLISFFDPGQGDKFQSSSALDAIKLGGLTGQGMGEGILKDSVPEAHTDYIVSVISEEFGAVMIFFILLVFLIFLFKIFKKISYLKNDKIKFIIFGCGIIIFFLVSVVKRIIVIL